MEGSLSPQPCFLLLETLHIFLTEERTSVCKPGMELPMRDQITGSDGLSGNQEERGKRLTTVTQTEEVS